MSNKILILGNVDEDLTPNTEGQNLVHVAQEFNCERIRIGGTTASRSLTLNMDIILGIRWPFYVVLRGPLFGMKEPKAMGYVGHVEELGHVLMKETVPR